MWFIIGVLMRKGFLHSIIARDVLSIPITTVASKYAFNISGHILTKYRNFTLPEHIQMLIYTRNWLH